MFHLAILFVSFGTLFMSFMHVSVEFQIIFIQSWWILSVQQIWHARCCSVPWAVGKQAFSHMDDFTWALSQRRWAMICKQVQSFPEIICHVGLKRNILLSSFAIFWVGIWRIWAFELLVWERWNLLIIISSLLWGNWKFSVVSIFWN